MVERNVVEGVKNNVYGTLYAVQTARACGVDTYKCYGRISHK